MQEVKKVPKLRFPEFRGEWKVDSLRELTDLITKGTTPKNFVSDGVKYIKIESLKGIEIDTSKCLFIDEATHNKELKRSILKEGDLLFAIAGATIGKCTIVPKAILPANTNQALSIIRLKDSQNKDYILQILTSRRMKKYINDNIAVGAQPNLNLEQIGSFSFSLPTLPEQTKIANFLSAVDAKIANLSEEKSLLENYKKGVMQKIFSQELRFKQDDGSNFPEWETKRLGEVFSIGSGKDYKHLSNGDIPVYGTGGLMTKVNEFLFDGKSVCIGRKGTIDKPMFLNGKFWTVDTLFYTHSFKNVTPEFVYYVFLGINWQKFNEASGVPSLSKRTIEQIPIEHPTIEEQTKIANFLTSIDEKINTATEAIENAQTFKKGLLQQLFV